MHEMSAIEEWFYGLTYSDFSDDDSRRRRLTGRSRIETSRKDKWTTTSTSFYSPDRTLERAMGVKMVADELLAATGSVVGGTLGLIAHPGSPYLGVKSGAQVGRNLGNLMWRTTVFLMDDRPLSQQFNKGQSFGPQGYQFPY